MDSMKQLLLVLSMHGFHSHNHNHGFPHSIYAGILFESLRVATIDAGFHLPSQEAQVSLAAASRLLQWAIKYRCIPVDSENMSLHSKPIFCNWLACNLLNHMVADIVFQRTNFMIPLATYTYPNTHCMGKVLARPLVDSENPVQGCIRICVLQ